jgi:hypothetical protein
VLHHFDRIASRLLGDSKPDARIPVNPQFALDILKGVDHRAEVTNENRSTFAIGHDYGSDVFQTPKFARRPDDHFPLVVEHVAGGDVPVLACHRLAHGQRADAQ